MKRYLAALLGLVLALSPGHALAQGSIAGSQVTVPRVAPLPGRAPAQPAASPRPQAAVPQTLVDVNSAEGAALDALPGVGPARAKAIVLGRPWLDKQELVKRKAIPASVLADIQNMIALVNVNSATAEEMVKILPNVGPVRAAAIVKNRPYATPQDTVAKGALTQGVFDGIKGMVTAK